MASPTPVDLSEVKELLQKVVAFDQEGDHDSAFGALVQAGDRLDGLKFQQARRREARDALPSGMLG